MKSLGRLIVHLNRFSDFIFFSKKVVEGNRQSEEGACYFFLVLTTHHYKMRCLSVGLMDLLSKLFELIRLPRVIVI